MDGAIIQEVPIKDIISIFFTSILAVATIFLVIYTYKLAQHTKALSELTKQLVNIEQARERREQREKRRGEITILLGLAGNLRKINPNDFVKELEHRGKSPEPESSYIRELALKNQYIKDPDTVLALKELRAILDALDEGSSIGVNLSDVGNKLKQVQERIVWSITEWREE